MRRFDTKKLFLSLCGQEYKILRYLNKKQGEAAAPIDFYAVAEALGISKEAVRTSLRRLVKAGVLIAEGENFRINEEYYEEL